MDNVVYGEHIFLARGIKYLHLVIVFIATWGWALPWPQSWWITFVLVPVIKLHWKTNDNICVLTTLENKYRGYNNAGLHDQEWFIKRLLSVFVKKLPSDNQIWLGMNIIMWTSWLFASLRLFVL